MPDVTPDDDNDGVEVYREKWRYATGDDSQHQYRQGEPPFATGEPGRWFTTLRAEQLLAGERDRTDVEEEVSDRVTEETRRIEEENAKLRAVVAAIDYRGQGHATIVDSERFYAALDAYDTARTLDELRLEIEQTINDVREQGLGIASTATAILALLIPSGTPDGGAG